MKTKLTKYITEIIAVALLFGIGIQTIRIEQHKANHAGLEAEYARYKETQARAVLELNAAHQKEIEQIGRDGDEKLNQAQAMLDRAADDLNGLRSENARLRTARNSTAASQCKAEYERIGVLTGLLDECAAKYTAMAGVAQRSRVSGLTCEGAYKVVGK